MPNVMTKLMAIAVDVTNIMKRVKMVNVNLAHVLVSNVKQV